MEVSWPRSFPQDLKISTQDLGQEFSTGVAITIDTEGLSEGPEIQEEGLNLNQLQMILDIHDNTLMAVETKTGIVELVNIGRFIKGEMPTRGEVKAAVRTGSEY